MLVRKFAVADASFERSPGQDGDVFAGNVIDQRQGGPITIGFGRYGPNQSIEETLAVDDVMVVLEGRLSITSEGGTVAAGPGEIVPTCPRASPSPSAHISKGRSLLTSRISIGEKRLSNCPQILPGCRDRRRLLCPMSRHCPPRRARRLRRLPVSAVKVNRKRSHM